MIWKNKVANYHIWSKYLDIPFCSGPIFCKVQTQVSVYKTWQTVCTWPAAGLAQSALFAKKFVQIFRLNK